MRRAAQAVLLLVALCLALVAAAAVRLAFLAPERIERALAAAVHAAGGAPARAAGGAALATVATVGGVDWSYAPFPAARLRDVRIRLPGCGASGSAEIAPRGALDCELHVPRATLGLSAPGLVFGRLVVRSATIEAPVLRVMAASEPAHAGRDEAGGPASRFAERFEPASPEAALGQPNDDGDVMLAVTRARFSDGRIVAEAWRAEALEGHVRLRADAAIELALRGQADGLGPIEQARLALWPISMHDEKAWNLSLHLPSLDLAALALALDTAGPVPQGRADVRVDLAGRGATPEEGDVAVDVVDLHWGDGSLGAEGALRLRAAVGGRLALTLDELAWASGTLAKPGGAPLELSARLPSEWPPPRIDALRVESPAIRFEGALAMEVPSQAPALLTGEALEIDLAALGDWWRSDAPLRPASGMITASDLRVELGGHEPGRTLHARLALAGAAVALRSFEGDDAGGAREAAPRTPRGASASERPGAARPLPPSPVPPLRIALDGPVAIDRGVLSTPGLDARIGGAPLALDGSVDPFGRRFALHLVTAGLELGDLLGAATTEPALLGRLEGEARLAGGAELRSLRGEGRFDLRDAHIPGAAFPWPVEAQDPRWTSGDEDDSFDRLAGTFSIADGVASIDRVHFEHPYVSALLRGDVDLAARQLDLAGELEIREELDLGLGGEGERRVLGLRRIHGPLSDPRFEFADDEVRAVMHGYAQRLREREASLP